LIAEIFLAVHELLFSLNILLPLFTRFRTSQRPRQLLVGKQVPTVDVCITCCGEPTDVVLNTIAAASAQNYPANKFRVFVLDDGHSLALRTSVQALGARLKQKGGPEIFYKSRIVKQGEHSYFKAGNLRFGIQEAKKAGYSEYFASLDADMITEPDWLRRMLPYLLADPQIALANPPQVTFKSYRAIRLFQKLTQSQNYYNAPNGDPLAQQTDLDVFFNLYEPLNDAMDAARCMGSGFVARHSALADIGGWPLIDVGEDFMLSSCFHHAGWKTAYVGEKVQWGLAPESFCRHLKQKKRWVSKHLISQLHYRV
jgi:cellulose synthase/poly-beta-1,6-N-acetylglucosamine synthase-like glycosyltransferase